MRACTSGSSKNCLPAGRYLGHELAVPDMGDYYALPHEGEGRALVRNARALS